MYKVIHSYNRNFAGRHDANPATHAFIASPEIVTALAFAGDLTFNPLTDKLCDGDGRPFAFSKPTGARFPARGYDPGRDAFQRPPDNRASLSIYIDPNSDRLRLLEPFKPRHGISPTDLPILIKVKGSCSEYYIYRLFHNYAY
jgi:aconitate hydratase